MNCAEAYSCTPHKRFRRLTLKLLKRAIYGRKIDNFTKTKKVIDDQPITP